MGYVRSQVTVNEPVQSPILTVDATRAAPDPSDAINVTALVDLGNFTETIDWFDLTVLLQAAFTDTAVCTDLSPICQVPQDARANPACS